MGEDPRFRNRGPEASSASAYLRGYLETLRSALEQLPDQDVEGAFALLREASERGARIFAAGNGGSAAIADHLCCDWMKGTQVADRPGLQVLSFTANVSLLTALSNDFGYEEGFARQLEMQGRKGDLLVLISSSGNSPNVVRAAELARRKEMKVIGMTGFGGGRLAELADASLHVPVDNYGVAEDSHQMLMHVFAQFLAQLRDRRE